MSVHALPFPSFSERPLRVLRADLSQRVAAVNRVRAWLCAAGIAVASQDLIRDGQRPLLRLVKGAPRLRGAAVSIRLRGEHITAVIQDVDVQWPHTPDASLH